MILLPAARAIYAAGDPMHLRASFDVLFAVSRRSGPWTAPASMRTNCRGARGAGLRAMRARICQLADELELEAPS